MKGFVDPRRPFGSLGRVVCASDLDFRHGVICWFVWLSFTPDAWRRWSLWREMSEPVVPAFGERGLRPGLSQCAEPHCLVVNSNNEGKADTRTLSSISAWMSTTTPSPFPSRASCRLRLGHHARRERTPDGSDGRGQLKGRAAVFPSLLLTAATGASPTPGCRSRRIQNLSNPPRQIFCRTVARFKTARTFSHRLAHG